MFGKLTPLLALGASLAGCGGAKDAVADQVEAKADNRADALDAQSRRLPEGRQSDLVRNQADMVRSAGKDQADAIRQSPLDANNLSQKEKDAIIKARIPEPGASEAR